MMSDNAEMPTDPFLDDEARRRFLQTRAFRASQIARDLLAAAQSLGLDTERYHELVAATSDVNAHFNPAVRIQHGRTSGPGA